ncbi:MAG: DUF6384 family protein [Planctomycetota bacterium]
MSEPVAATPQVQQPDAEPIALDRVMLAMDVVDTLRHQRELVERELDGERRQRELVQRVQQLYESQGIDVSEEVVAEGVRALEQDRFVYRPPQRTFAVRLAEVYVERGKWSKRAAVVVLLAAVAWGAIAIPRHVHRQGLIERFAGAVARVEAQVDAQLRDGQGLEATLSLAAGQQPTPPQAVLLERAEGHLANGIGRAESARAALRQLPAGDDYADDQARGDASLSACRREAEVADGELDAARRALAATQRLGQLGEQFAAAQLRLQSTQLAPADAQRIAAAGDAVAAALQTTDDGAADAALAAYVQQIDALFAARQREAEVRARLVAAASALTGVEVVADARAELQSLRDGAEAALAAGDVARAGELVGKLGELVAVLDQSYELRIVSRPGVQSGVWRYLDGDRSKRNYYIIVEAVGADGHVRSLPIRDEEQQRTRNVKRFGVRVPIGVYERVKADKLDNNLIDDVVFGHKRRGARSPEFRFPVAGGYITEW